MIEIKSESKTFTDDTTAGLDKQIRDYIAGVQVELKKPQKGPGEPHPRLSAEWNYNMAEYHFHTTVVPGYQFKVHKEIPVVKTPAVVQNGEIVAPAEMGIEVQTDYEHVLPKIMYHCMVVFR